MKKILITQSNYIPWKGYFDNIAQCDIFVVYDDMQYTKRDWRNRNYIKTPHGPDWLTIPVNVKGRYFQKINETVISDPDWPDSHWHILKQYYSRSTFFKDISPWIEELYKNATYLTITEINVHFLKAICKFLGINTIFIDSREFTLVEGKTEKLVAICRELNATEYYTGPSAKNYIDETLFQAEGISLKYFNYAGYAEYPQLYEPFEHGVSILDLILNVGQDSKKFLKNIK